MASTAIARSGFSSCSLLPQLGSSVSDFGRLVPQCPAASSLVFDCEVEDVSQPAPQRSRKEVRDVCERVRYFCEPNGDFARKLLRDVRAFKKAVLREEGAADTVVLATKLANVGYTLTLRKALGGGAACFRNLRHEFLVVRGSGDYEGISYIVEPAFKEQFVISQPTDDYERVLEGLPAEYVGTASRLIPVVQTLCKELSLSFESRNLTVPPWRRTGSVLSKWLPVKSHDQTFNCPKFDGSCNSPSGSTALPTAWRQALADSSNVDQKTKSLLSHDLHRRSSLEFAPDIVVKPSAYKGQPPTYTIRRQLS